MVVIADRYGGVIGVFVADKFKVMCNCRGYLRHASLCANDACAIVNARKVLSKSIAYRKANYQQIKEKNRARRNADIPRARERERQSHRRNREHRNAYNRLYEAANPEKARIRRKSWRDRNQDHIKKYQRFRYDKEVRGLGDGYIKQLLVSGTRLKAVQIPNQVIELKRMQVSVHRTIKELKK